MKLERRVRALEADNDCGEWSGVLDRLSVDELERLEALIVKLSVESSPDALSASNIALVEKLDSLREAA